MNTLDWLGQISGDSHTQPVAELIGEHAEYTLAQVWRISKAEMRPGGVKGGQIGQGYVTNPRTSR